MTSSKRASVAGWPVRHVEETTIDTEGRSAGAGDPASVANNSAASATLRVSGPGLSCRELMGTTP